MRQLVAAAAALGIALDASQQRRFRQFFELLDQSGRQVNLTGARGWNRVRDELIVRSLGFLAGDHLASKDGVHSAVIDVGSGAGVPGIVLKLVHPGLELTLLDSSAKKTEFLASAVDALELDGVDVVKARAEEAARDPAFRERYHCVLARGLAALPELAELTLPFARQGGVVLALKPDSATQELASAAYAAEILGAAPGCILDASAGGRHPKDRLVVWRKIAPTPQRFPRRAGVPHRRPIVQPGPRLRPAATVAT